MSRLEVSNMCEFKVGDLVVTTSHHSNFKKIIRVDKVCKINIESCNHYDDDRKFPHLLLSKKEIRHATPEEIKAGRRLP